MCGPLSWTRETGARGERPEQAEMLLQLHLCVGCLQLLPLRSAAVAPGACSHCLLHAAMHAAVRSKVFEKLCDDFGSKRRERVVRLDVPLRAFDGPGAPAASAAAAGARARGQQGAAAVAAPSAVAAAGGGLMAAAGLPELAAGLRDSIRTAFEARQVAYDAEVRAHGSRLVLDVEQ